MGAMSNSQVKAVLWGGIALVCAGALWWISLYNTGAERRGDCSLRKLQNTLDPATAVPLNCESAPSVMPALIVVVIGAAVIGFAYATVKGARQPSQR